MQSLVKKNHLSGHTDWGLPALTVKHSGTAKAQELDMGLVFTLIFYLTALSGILFHLQHAVSSWNAWFLEIQDQISISALLLLLSVSLPVLLAFLEKKNCASFHIPNVEKGLDVCGTLIFPVTCWLSFPFFQCPSSPPTLSCPQTSPPSLWVLIWQSGEVSSFWYTTFPGPFLPKITAALSKVFQN